MEKSEICLHLMRAYLLWARGATRQHDYYEYYLVQARLAYIACEFWRRVEREPTEEINTLYYFKEAA